MILALLTTIGDELMNHFFGRDVVYDRSFVSTINDKYSGNRVIRNRISFVVKREATVFFLRLSNIVFFCRPRRL